MSVGYLLDKLTLMVAHKEWLLLPLLQFIGNDDICVKSIYEAADVIFVLIAWSRNEGSSEPGHLRRFARASDASIHKVSM